MDTILNITLTVNRDGTLTVQDYSKYEELMTDLSLHGFIEFITDDNEDVVDDRLYDLEDETSVIYNANPFFLFKDGVYTYHRLVIPKLAHFENENGQYEVEGKYFIQYDKLYKGKRVFGNPAPSGVNENAELITDIKLAWREIVSNAIELDNQCFWYSAHVLSIPTFEKCLLNLQRNSLKSSLKSCMIDCSKDTELRDFVQHSVSVLHHLVAIGDNKGAINLLKDLNRCNLICGNVVLENNCGCGKSR